MSFIQGVENKLFMLSHYAKSSYGECNYGECHYAECHYAEWRRCENFPLALIKLMLGVLTISQLFHPNCPKLTRILMLMTCQNDHFKIFCNGSNL